MQKIAFFLALALATQASANDVARCGTDAFGNDVCMDKDGVITTAPKRAAADKTGRTTGGKHAPDGAKTDSASKTDSDDKATRTRCGVDPFGNTVCR
jgi:hypothetical protein